MLEVKNITKKFADNVAVNNVSFNVENGRIFGLLGRNGAGKSTIFRIILGIHKQDNGQITYNGKQIDERLKDKIGYLPEEGSLIENFTVIQQFVYYGILKGLSESKVRKNAVKWLNEFKISEYFNMKIKNLSKGNRQKIQFIVALLNDPEILILDEPFSGLDPVSVEEFKNVILKLKEEGKIIIFSSHRMDHVEMLCEDILILEKGNTVLQGEMSKIKNEYGNKKIYVEGLFEDFDVKELEKISGVENILLDGNKLIISVISSAVIKDVFDGLRGKNVTNFYTTDISLNEIFIDKVGKKYEDE